MVLPVGLRGRDTGGTGHRGKVGMGHIAVRDSLGRFGQGFESRLPLLGLAGTRMVGKEPFDFENVSILFHNSTQQTVET